MASLLFVFSILLSDVVLATAAPTCDNEEEITVYGEIHGSEASEKIKNELTDVLLKSQSVVLYEGLPNSYDHSNEFHRYHLEGFIGDEKLYEELMGQIKSGEDTIVQAATIFGSMSTVYLNYSATTGTNFSQIDQAIQIINLTWEALNLPQVQEFVLSTAELKNNEFSDYPEIVRIMSSFNPIVYSEYLTNALSGPQEKRLKASQFFSVLYSRASAKLEERYNQAKLYPAPFPEGIFASEAITLNNPLREWIMFSRMKEAYCNSNQKVYGLYG